MIKNISHLIALSKSLIFLCQIGLGVKKGKFYCSQIKLIYRMLFKVARNSIMAERPKKIKMVYYCEK